jgi:hypothetical protein
MANNGLLVQQCEDIYLPIPTSAASRMNKQGFRKQREWKLEGRRTAHRTIRTWLSWAPNSELIRQDVPSSSCKFWPHFGGFVRFVKLRFSFNGA